MHIFLTDVRIKTAVFVARNFRNCKVTLYSERTLARPLRPHNLEILDIYVNPDICTQVTIKNDKGEVSYRGSAEYSGGRPALRKHLIEIIATIIDEDECDKENQDPLEDSTLTD